MKNLTHFLYDSKHLRVLIRVREARDSNQVKSLIRVNLDRAKQRYVKNCLIWIKGSKGDPYLSNWNQVHLVIRVTKLPNSSQSVWKNLVCICSIRFESIYVHDSNHAHKISNFHDFQNTLRFFFPSNLNQ